MNNNSDSHSILIIVPSYNAASTLDELIGRLRTVLDLPILIVDDGSSDNTSEVAASSSATCIRFQFNRGKGAALKTGFRFAIDHGYTAVITIDADLQHLPEEVPHLVERFGGPTILIGTRDIHPSVMPFGRWLSNNWTSAIISILSYQRIRDSQSGFRLIPTSILKELDLQADGYDLESELLFKASLAGHRVEEVAVSTVYSDETSHISPFRDTGRFLRQIWKRIWM